ncbi:hypothetical protein G6F43_012821 [Rhizopus delemar]|nr:hypothetical protein G6F43_012821 [Rhizopus delemar]
MKADPYNYFTYQKITEAPEKNNQSEVKTKKIVNQAQLITFLNTAFLPVNPNNEEAYACKSLSMNDILSVVWKYADIFSEKTAYGFGKWCTSRKLCLTESGIKRKFNDLQQKVLVRSLYVLKDEYIDNVIEEIVSHLPRYQKFIQSLKDEGYHVIGYARKSTCKKDDDSRVRLLNLMCKNLKNRSLVSKVFASVYCDSNESLLERDLNKQEHILSQIQADGDMQDMLVYISSLERVCIVAIDFAGLTTNCEDLKVFLKNNPNIKKSIIDKLASCDASHVYDIQELLNDSDKIKYK